MPRRKPNPEDFNLPETEFVVGDTATEAANRAKAGAAQRVLELEARMFEDLEADRLASMPALISRWVLYAMISNRMLNIKMVSLAMSVIGNMVKKDDTLSDDALDAALDEDEAT